MTAGVGGGEQQGKRNEADLNFNSICTILLRPVSFFPETIGKLFCVTQLSFLSSAFLRVSSLAPTFCVPLISSPTIRSQCSSWVHVAFSAPFFQLNHVTLGFVSSPFSIGKTAETQPYGSGRFVGRSGIVYISIYIFNRQLLLASLVPNVCECTDAVAKLLCCLHLNCANTRPPKPPPHHRVPLQPPRGIAGTGNGWVLCVHCKFIKIIIMIISSSFGKSTNIQEG